MKNVIFFLVGFVLSLLYSCTSSADSAEKTDIFPGDTVLVENDYPPIEDTSVLSAMQQLKICSLSDTNTVLEPCDYTKFRVFELGTEVPLSKGFILEMKEGLYNAPVKQLIIIEKSFNQFKITNRYFGFLIEFRTKKTGYNDLLIGYKDPEMGLIAIRHQWMKEKYEPVSVEEINGYFIKPELQDSIDDLFISNFNAGY